MGASNPKIKLSYNDGAWNDLESSFYEIARDSIVGANNKELDTWYKFAYQITPTSNTVNLRILDNAFENGSWGDDLTISGIGLYACRPNLQPVAEYRFDECEWTGAAGEVKDSGSNGLDATAVGATLTSGVINTAGKFDGNAYIDIPSNTELSLTGDMSMSFWVNPTDQTYSTSNTIQNIIVKGFGTEFRVDYWYDGVQNCLCVAYTHGDNSQMVDPDNDKIYWDHWYHVTLTRDTVTKTVSFYIDGTLIDTKPYDTLSIGDPTAQVSGVTIASGTSAAKFKGEIDEVKFFDGVLSKTQVSDIYNNEKNGLNYDGTVRPVVDCSLSPIGCEPSAWLLNDTLDVYEQNMSSVANTVHSNALVEYANGIGYNPADGFIWGYVNTSSTEQMLIKIGKDTSGNLASVMTGPILGTGGYPDLPLGTGASKAYINIGDVSSDGKLHLLYRENASLGLSAETDHLYVIDLNSSSANYQKVTYHTTISNGGNGLSIVDWAFHPSNGKIYAFSTSFGGAATLFEVDPASGYAVATHNVTGLSNIDDTNYEAFFDDQGIFYGYAPSEGRVFRLDLSDPSNPATVAEVFALVGTGNGGDTARCSKAPFPRMPMNVVAEYRFDDCAAWLSDNGVVEDSSGNNLHGSTKNGVQLTTGKLNSGALFDGTSYIEVPNDPKLQLTGDMAISFWIKPIDAAYALANPEQSLIVKGLGTEFKVKLSYDSANAWFNTKYDHYNDTTANQ